MRNRGIIRILGLLGISLAAFSGCKDASPRLLGGGSSFINPLMQEKWVKTYYNQKHVQIDYSSTGSGDGVKGVISNQRQFGCSDAPLNAEQLEQAGGPKAVLQIPVVVGAVVPICNLPGLNKPLNLNGKVLGDIYLGKITTWGHPDLVALDNEELEGREDKITPIHRDAASGTTYIWTSYLCAASPRWKDEYQEPQTMPVWKGGLAAANNNAVAINVSKIEGAIGYVELTYALQSSENKLQVARVRNADDSAYVEANLETARAAASHLKKVPDDLSQLSFVNAPGKDSYPIVGTTWAVVKVKQTPENARLLKDFLHWAVSEGQKNTVDLNYVPLPERVSKKANGKIDKIEG